MISRSAVNRWNVFYLRQWNSLLRLRERWRSIVISMFVCVCLWHCLSVREHISGARRAIFAKFLCMVPMAVARSSSGRVTKSQEEGKVSGDFLPHRQRTVTRWLEITLCSSKRNHSSLPGVLGVHSAGEVWSTIALFQKVSNKIHGGNCVKS